MNCTIKSTMGEEYTWTGNQDEWLHRNESGLEMIHKYVSAYTVEVFVAFGSPTVGGVSVVKEYCESCRTMGTDSVGLCVTVEGVTFVHTDGIESGYKVGVRNYARFPKTRQQILDHAIRLAELLIEKLDQDTAMVDAPDATVWVRRKDKLNAG